MGGRGSSSRRGGAAGAAGAAADADASAGLGTLMRTYPDGTQRYELPNVEVTGEEREDYLVRMGSYVRAEFGRQEGFERGTYELNTETGRIEVWTKDYAIDDGRGGVIRTSGKLFFDTVVTGTQVTTVKPDGKKKKRIEDDRVSFRLVGSKL